MSEVSLFSGDPPRVGLWTLLLKRRPPHSRAGGGERALPTGIHVERATLPSTSGASVDVGKEQGRSETWNPAGVPRPQENVQPSRTPA